jgi:hypothetical protein
MKKVSCPNCNADSGDDRITVHSGVNQNAAGFVHIAWGRESELRAQFSPEEARQHALVLLAAAEAAEMDSMVIRFFMEGDGNMVHGARFLSVLRQYRDTTQAKGDK